MLKVTIFLSGVLSFVYFLFPAHLSEGFSTEKVLGIKSINQAVNRQTVYTAVLAYCLDQGELPHNLNRLYEKELSPERKIDLESLYRLEFTDPSVCEFKLNVVS